MQWRHLKLWREVRRGALEQSALEQSALEQSALEHSAPALEQVLQPRSRSTLPCALASLMGPGAGPSRAAFCSAELTLSCCVLLSLRVQCRCSRAS